MEHLPFEVLRQILSQIEVRRQFALMRVSRTFESAIRSLLAEHRKLIVKEESCFWCPCDADETLVFVNPKEEWLTRFWISLQKVGPLISITVCEKVRGACNEAGVASLVAINAAHLQKLHVSHWFPPSTRPALPLTLTVPMPLLRVIGGCNASDLSSLADMSPFLREVLVIDSDFPADAMNHLARLQHLEVLQIRVSGWLVDAPDSLITLFRGAGRRSVEKVACFELTSDRDKSVVEQELALIQRETGRKPDFSVSTWMSPHPRI